MRFIKQLFGHQPEEGIFGDCYRTAIACLLDLDPSEVPHEHRFMTDEEHTALYLDWFRERGIHRIAVPMQCESVQQALDVSANWSQGLPYIFTGRSQRGVNHCVVGHGAKIIHDPHPSGVGIDGPADPQGYYWVEWLVVPAIVKVAP